MTRRLFCNAGKSYRWLQGRDRTGEAQYNFVQRQRRLKSGRQRNENSRKAASMTVVQKAMLPVGQERASTPPGP
jgi:hypothetical protein